MKKLTKATIEIEEMTIILIMLLFVSFVILDKPGLKNISVLNDVNKAN